MTEQDKSASSSRGGIHDETNNQINNAGQTAEQSLITDDSMIREVDMTEEQKKRKLEDLHSTHDFSKLKVDDYEVIKLKRVLRQNMFPVVKFLRGEGNSHMGTRTDVMRTLKHRPVIGKCHDFADLNKKTGCEIEIMKL